MNVIRATGRAAPVDGSYADVDGAVVVSGVQALVRLPMDQRRADVDAGLRTAGFVTGYPGSPLAGYDVELARHKELLAELGIVHQPALNEELGATAVAGSQLTSLQPGRHVEGVSALWYAKAPGLERAGDAVRHGNLMGAARAGGVLVCVGDDPQAQSSSVPSTSEPTLHALGLPVLSPADPQELLDLGIHGFALSRASGLWVGMRIPASVADALQTIEVGPGRVVPVMPELDVDGHPFVHRPSARLLGATLIELERTLYGPRLEAARRYTAANHLDRITASGREDVLGVVAAGPAYLAVRHAFGRVGLRDDRALATAGMRLLKVAVPYPIDAEAVRRFGRGLREVVVVEDKRAFLELMVKDALYGMTGAPAVVGKLDEVGRELVPSTGEVDPDQLATALAARLLRLRDLPGVRHAADAAEARRRGSVDPPLPIVRSAYFCAGCPHNTGVRVPPGAVVGSGSGCHGLAIQMSARRAGDLVGRFQMGGEGAMWNGMAPFVSVGHFFQNLGDGTFAHSGSLSVRASVAAGVDITYKLLVNSVVAMTGGQAIPGGSSLADLCRMLVAEGVQKVIVTTDDLHRLAHAGLPKGIEVWDRHRILDAEEALARIPGVTVLLHDQECALERGRRERRSGPALSRRVFINPLACDGCGDCGAVSNCVSVRPVETEHGSRTEIHQETCNLDYTCLDADCPAMLTVEPGGGTGYGAADIEAGAIPPAPRVTQRRACNVRITGVGGTGVLTTARIVADAAHRSGWWVRGLDQTGIAQKGGSVCSDLRLGAGPLDEVPSRLGADECDLYLGCDLLVAAEPRHLGVAAPDRTVAIMSTCAVPTGREVEDRSVAPPDLDDLRFRVQRRTRAGEAVFFDAQRLSRQRFGTDVYANILLLGVAYQRGALPVDAEHLETSIRRNGVAPEANIQAFRYGRLIVAGVGADIAGAPGASGAPGAPGDPREPALRPEALELVRVVGAAPGSELDRIVRTRLSDLLFYQDRAYARRYADAVARCRRAEASRCPGAGDAFSRTAAVQLHRLMAYRDEYEVARLHRSPTLRSEVASRFGAGARAQFHLRPPLLKRLGFERKVTLGRSADVAFGVLASLRALRGTRLDPFGRTELRRGEREVRDQYERLLSDLCDSLTPERHERAVELAGLPDAVRGYGSHKAAALRRLQATLEGLDGRRPGTPATASAGDPGPPR